MNDELGEIRQQKRQALMNQGGKSDENQETSTEPIRVEGSEHLDELVETHDVVLVDFYADWCGPCKILEPTLESVASETDAAVAKVDIDQHQLLARQNQVRGVPTLQLYADGEAVKQVVGVQDEATLTSLVERFA